MIPPVAPDFDESAFVHPPSFPFKFHADPFSLPLSPVFALREDVRTDNARPFTLLRWSIVATLRSILLNGLIYRLLIHIWLLGHVFRPLVFVLVLQVAIKGWEESGSKSTKLNEVKFVRGSRPIVTSKLSNSYG